MRALVFLLNRFQIFQLLFFLLLKTFDFFKTISIENETIDLISFVVQSTVQKIKLFVLFKRVLRQREKLSKDLRLNGRILF